MATVQSLQHSGMSTASSCPSGSSDGFIENGGLPAQFPAGLRVLVVDDDPVCLKILEKMLRRCLYEVTICCRATDALSTLRQRKSSFDLVISDVYMPDMDGFKLLEHIGLEMDLPVIMMSADGETSVVMKGIKHGACDYLLKPVRMEELRNIWQHVVRKKRNGRRDLEHSGSVDETEQHKKGSDDDYASSVNEGTDGNWKTSKRRKSVMEEDDDFGQENDDPSSLKKPRVVWSVELHQQFVGAVNQLGIDKAVPKRILEIMNVPGLTRENVASHLQKYRLYLRRLSGVAQQQSGMNSSFGGNTGTNFGSTGSLGNLDLQTLASSGQITPQALVALQAGLLGRVNANNGLGIPGEALCLEASLQSINSNSSNRAMFGQPLVNSQGNSLEGLPSGFQLRSLGQPQPHVPSFGNMGLSLNDKSLMLEQQQQQQLPTAAMGLGDLGQVCAMDNSTSINRHNNALMVQLIQQQRQQQQLNQCMQTTAPQPHQTGVQLQGRQVFSLPSASLLGLPVLSEDFGGRTNPLPATGNDNSVIGASSGQVNRMLPSEDGLSVCASNAYMGIDRMPAVDYKNHGLHKMLGNSLCPQGIVGASAPSSIVIEDEVSMQGTKNFGGAPETVNSQTFGGSGLNFSTSSAHDLSLSQRNMQGWQVQNFALDQDLSQIVTPVLSPRYGRASSGNHGLNVPGIQDHRQVQCPRFIGKGLGPPSRSTADAGCLKTVSNTQYQGDKSTADNGLTLKVGVSGLMGSSKMDGGLVSEQSLTSGNPVNLLYKQQQGGAGLAGGEFGMDGYQLNNVNA